jgi:hypothetical protein
MLRLRSPPRNPNVSRVCFHRTEWMRSPPTSRIPPRILHRDTRRKHLTPSEFRARNPSAAARCRICAHTKTRARGTTRIRCGCCQSRAVRATSAAADALDRVYASRPTAHATRNSHHEERCFARCGQRTTRVRLGCPNHRSSLFVCGHHDRRQFARSRARRQEKAFFFQTDFACDPGDSLFDSRAFRSTPKSIKQRRGVVAGVHRSQTRAAVRMAPRPSPSRASLRVFIYKSMRDACDVTDAVHA